MSLKEKIAQMKTEIPETAMWLDTFKANSPRTADGYATSLLTVLDGLNIHSFAGIKDFSMADLTRIYDLSAERGWTKHTINQHIANLKRFVDWCNDEELCDNRTLNKFKKLKSEADPTFVFTYEEQDKILSAVTSKRLRCILNLFLEIGARKASVQNLKVSDLCGDMLTVTDKGDKTTTHRLSAELVEMLNDYIATDRAETMKRYCAAGGTDKGWMFVSNFVHGNNRTDWKDGLQTSPNTLNDQIKNLARKAGVANWNRVTPHSFRKRFGINTYYSNGMDIIATQRAMKHSSSNLTAYYVGKYNISEAEKNVLMHKNSDDDLRKQLEEALAKLAEIAAQTAHN